LKTLIPYPKVGVLNGKVDHSNHQNRRRPATRQYP